MPVPVPLHTKPLAHPVIKQKHTGPADPNHPSLFQNLTRTLPVAPTGPPPSFGTREQWINSLPTWRRTKPRRIWEDDSRITEQCIEQNFQQGLTVVDNTTVIKGARAQACNPPLVQTSTLQPLVLPTKLLQGLDEDADDEMSSEYSTIDQGQVVNKPHATVGSSVEKWSNFLDVEKDRQAVMMGGLAVNNFAATPVENGPAHERGAFSPPVYEDESPGIANGQDLTSSPIEPITPFGEFVDRAVGAVQPCIAYTSGIPAMAGMHEPQFSYQDKVCGPQCYQPQSYMPEQRKEQPPAPEVATPSATTSYKKLAEPLSEWVANYVWKVCTVGLSLPSKFVSTCGPATAQYPSSPPSYLTGSIHSLLLSTLLQPSAVFLAIWYIVRLPVSFEANEIGSEHMAEWRFMVELLGDSCSGPGREALEASAPFRLVLLGFMLANKWLDDHTFSNKTWHSISNVPIQSLNKLESLALDIFSHDLSIASYDWSQWLGHVHSYHLSLSSPSHPQPISRPSTNPHSIIRKAIEEIREVPAAYETSPFSSPEPVFLGLEERRAEKLRKEQALAASCVDVLEIDLDQDGPLREEYLPKRRVSGAGSIRSINSRVINGSGVPADKSQVWERRGSQRLTDMEKLPPPAKWSPAGDEPILRERNRATGHYVAVQPPLANSVAFTSTPAQYQPRQEVGYRNWSAAAGYVSINPMSIAGYAYDPAAMQVSQQLYNLYPFVLPVPLPHSRSHSLSYEQDHQQTLNRTRTNSHSLFDYECSDVRMSGNNLPPLQAVDTQWVNPSPYGYSGSYILPFASHPTVNHQPNWLRS